MTTLLPAVVPTPAEPLALAQGRGEPFLADDEGPEGNHGQVACAVCKHDGWLMDADDRGFLIVHAGRMFPCRAPR